MHRDTADISPTFWLPLPDTHTISRLQGRSWVGALGAPHPGAAEGWGGTEVLPTPGWGSRPKRTDCSQNSQARDTDPSLYPPPIADRDIRSRSDCPKIEPTARLAL